MKNKKVKSSNLTLPSPHLCVVCGKPLKRGKYTCSRECYNTLIVSDKTKSPNYKGISDKDKEDNKHCTSKGGTVTRYCPYCNRDFKFNVKDINDPKSLYCDKYCRTKYTIYNNKIHAYSNNECKVCGKQFVSIMQENDYCCLECECADKGITMDDLEHKIIIKGVCAHCNESFIPKDPSDIYCSNTCFLSSRVQGYVTKQCECCNTLMLVTKEQIKNGKVFCSESCYNKFIVITDMPENIKLNIYNKQPHKIICESCGILFESYKSITKYCCTQCEISNPTNFYPDDCMFTFNRPVNSVKSNNEGTGNAIRKSW